MQSHLPLLTFWRAVFAAAMTLLSPAFIFAQGPTPAAAPAGDTSDPAASLSPEQTSALIRQAFALSKQVDSLEGYNRVIDLLQRAKAGQPTESGKEYIAKLLAWAHNRRGEAYAEQAATLAEQGQADKAAQLDKQAAAEFERSLSLDDRKWKAYQNRGVSRALAGQMQEALADFNRVIQLEPKYANAYFNRAEIYYKQGRYDQAAEDYSKVIELRGGDAAAHTGRGHCRFRQGKHRQALADYIRAVELAPSDPARLLDRADAYTVVGLDERAADDYRNALRLAPNSGRGYQGAAWMMATSTDPRFQNSAMALRAARKAIELDGEKDFRYLDTLAAAQAAAGQFDEAQKSIAKALKLAPPAAREELNRRLDLYKANRPFRR